jgi:hypothetical protein
MIATAAILTLFLGAQPSATPAPETMHAFDRYISVAETSIRHQENSIDSFLALPSDVQAARDIRLRGDEVAISSVGPVPKAIPGGLIHDWVGAVVVHHVTVEQVLRVVQDYDQLVRYYAPTVMSSRLISHTGDDFHILLRMREHKVVTVVLDSEYDVHYGRLDASHQFSFSRSTHVAEVVDAGQPNEHPASAVENHGYLWALDSYWRFAQEGDDVVVECEAISLTRDIPKGLGWLIGPYLKDIPRESLRSTLINTRDAVASALP